MAFALRAQHNLVKLGAAIGSRAIRRWRKRVVVLVTRRYRSIPIDLALALHKRAWMWQEIAEN
jgi:hypothetical protein